MEREKRADNTTDGRLDCESFMLRKNGDAEGEITSKKPQEGSLYGNNT